MGKAKAEISKDWGPILTAFLPRLPFRGAFIDKESVEWECVRQDKVADIIAADSQGVHVNRLFVFHGELNRSQVGIH